jgi:acetoin utilization protein AcuB
MVIRDIMVRKVLTITQEASLEQARGLMQQGRVQHLPVVEPLPQVHPPRPSLIMYPPPTPPVSVIGLLSDREVRGNWAGERQVQEVMQRLVLTVTPQTPVEVAATLLADNAIGCLPVVAEEAQGRLVGLVTSNDLLRALARLVGVTEPSTCLHLKVRWGDPATLARVLQVVAHYTERLPGLFLEPTSLADDWPVTLRVPLLSPGPLLRALAAAGIAVEPLEAPAEEDDA